MWNPWCLSRPARQRRDSDIRAGIADGETARRRRRHALGHVGEWFAALYLMTKGYRVLGRRFRIRSGEIDLVVARNGVVAFIEVKLRRSQEEAEAALRDGEARRTHAAADRWMARRPRYQSYEQRFDAIFVIPGRWPMHIEGAF